MIESANLSWLWNNVIAIEQACSRKLDFRGATQKIRKSKDYGVVKKLLMFNILVSLTHIH